MIILDYQDRRPIYEQITEKFRMLIYQGALPAGSRIPSVRQLAMELSINPNTIQRAYMALEQEGLIYPVKGKGNFVAETRQIQEKSKEDFRREFQDLIKRGIHTGMTEEELILLVQKSYEEELG
ncbi:GntR family transcriptional regulator [Blautia sp. MSJ-19]|uniref:GntR family transcriptional regulator n=1 Tax=Blautia sp. MSJ-19 TaxID=2841517 RepID=UPI001C0E97C8|nr:GntR family transcriptional regulator [Blautia sp. MSJ-19]MBU5479977.1 GntR family transcriptional regulator [Blautia sp. MSJ-19]